MRGLLLSCYFLHQRRVEIRRNILRSLVHTVLDVELVGDPARAVHADQVVALFVRLETFLQVQQVRTLKVLLGNSSGGVCVLPAMILMASSCVAGS